MSRIQKANLSKGTAVKFLDLSLSPTAWIGDLKQLLKSRYYNFYVIADGSDDERDILEVTNSAHAYVLRKDYVIYVEHGEIKILDRKRFYKKYNVIRK